MEKATRFKKARIIALDAGVFVGSVARLILDLETRQVAGLLIEGGQHAIDGEDVRALGEDAVTITTATRIIDLGEAEELAAFIRNEDEVYRKEVFTVAGKKVGFITDVLIAPNSKQIVGFEMFSEFLFDEEVHGVILLNEEVIFGRDLVLVPSDIERLIARSADMVQPIAPPPVAPAPLPVPTPLPFTPPTPVVVPEAVLEPTPVVTTPAVVELPQPVQPEVGPEELSPFVHEAPPPVAVDFSMPAQPEPEVLHTEEPAVGEDETDDVAIDFSGVEVPTPEVLREAPEQPQDPAAETDKPDMEKIFASFPLGVQEEASDQTSGLTFGEAPESQPVEPDLPVVEEVVEEPPPPEPAKPASPKDKLIRFVLGKTSSRDIFDVDGNLILGKGQEITEEVVSKAQAAELMPQVFLAASQGLHSRLKRG